MVAVKPANCHHCHLPLVAGPTVHRVWCLACSNAPEGRCGYCKGDVLVPAACWPLQQQLDRALVRAQVGVADCCANCHTEMGVSVLTDTKAVFICPRCGRQLSVAWTWSRKAARGRPEAPRDPDSGPLPTY